MKKANMGSMGADLSAGELIRSGAYKALGGAAVATGLAGAGYLVHQAQKHRAAGPRGFYAMVREAGHEFDSLSHEDKDRAAKYYHAIAQHSPTVANDPIAAWNHVAHFIRHPSTYQPTSIEQLRKVETTGHQFFPTKPK